MAAVFGLTCVLLMVLQTGTALESSLCGHGQLVQVLEKLEPCRKAHRWTKDFCEIHHQVLECFTTGFTACFPEDLAGVLVQAEQEAMRKRIERNWQGKIPLQELEKLFNSCSFIALRPEEGSVQRHWLEYVKTDNSCGVHEKEEIKNLLSLRDQEDTSSLPGCVTERETDFIRKLLKPKETGVPEPRKSELQGSSSSAHRFANVTVLLLIFYLF